MFNNYHQSIIRNRLPKIKKRVRRKKTKSTGSFFGFIRASSSGFNIIIHLIIMMMLDTKIKNNFHHQKNQNNK